MHNNSESSDQKPANSAGGGSPSFTPGPWTYANDLRGVWEIIHDGDMLAQIWGCRPGLNGDLPAEANARLIAAAPAMDLMLKLITAGRARFERSTTCDLLEFCFDGMRYVVRDDDWTALVNVVGWNHARAKLAEGRPA